MAASKYNIRIEQGATFALPITWRAGNPAVAVNLTGCTARMHVRRALSASEILLSLTTENGRIVLGGLAGTVVLALTAAETAAIDWAHGVYDLEIVFGTGVVRRLLVGNVSVSREVTR
jgi:hypothetical protein